MKSSGILRARSGVPLQVVLGSMFCVALLLFTSCGSVQGTACTDSSGCSGGQTCQDGHCVEGPCQNDCAMGQSQCLEGGVATCAQQANGCLQFSAPAACSGSQVCSGGSCAAQCSDQCAEGTKRCSGLKVEVCQRLGTGCLDWSTPASCSAGAACSNNTCPGCTDACTAGTSMCASQTAQQQCQFGSSGCLEWTTKACSGAEQCVDTQCMPPMPCDPACPPTFSCNFLGQCTGGSLTGLVLNEQGFTVSGSVTINGAVPNKDSAYCSLTSNTNDAVATVSFTEPTRGYSSSVNIVCSSSGFSFSTSLPLGTYDVRVSLAQYSSQAKVNLLPVNYLAKKALVVSAPITALALDEQGFAVSGNVTVNGAAPNKDSAYCSLTSNTNDAVATVSFTEPTRGYSASVNIVCSSSGFSFSTSLPLGTYDVRVSLAQYSSQAKVNLLPVNYLAKKALVVDAPITALVLDEQGFAVSGSVTINGAAPNKDSAYCSLTSNTNDAVATVSFTEPTRGYSASVNIVCSSSGFSFSTSLPLGTYDVRVSLAQYSSQAKVNLLPVNYLARTALAVSAPITALTLDEQGFAVHGSVTINGAAPNKDSAYCSLTSNTNDAVATVSFTEPTRGYSSSVNIVCSSSGFAFDTSLPAGTYDVRVSLAQYSSQAKVNLLPVNYLARKALAVSAPITALVLDEQGFAVSGNVMINGAAPNKDSAYCSLAANTNDAVATVSFTEPTRGYSASVNIVCSSSGFSFSTSLPLGTYDVRVSLAQYSSQAKVNLLPVNYLAQTGLAVSAPITALVLNEQGFQVGGSVTINGAAPNKDSAYCSLAANLNDPVATVLFRDPTRGYSATVSILCGTPGFTFSTTLPLGTYAVRVELGQYASQAKVNLLPNSYLAVAKLKIP